MEEGLRKRTGGPVIKEETPAYGIASLAAAGGAFDWLTEEPDLYDEIGHSFCRTAAEDPRGIGA